MTKRTRTGDRYDRHPDGAPREQFSVRLTPSQMMAVMRRSRPGQTVADRVRGLLQASIDGTPWPRLIDGRVDEDASAWVQFRVTPDQRSDIYEYQQAVGARDMSVAVRSLVTAALALEGGG